MNLEAYIQNLALVGIEPRAVHPEYGPGLDDENARRALGLKDKHTMAVWRATGRRQTLETFRLGRKTFTSVRSIMAAMSEGAVK